MKEYKISQRLFIYWYFLHLKLRNFYVNYTRIIISSQDGPCFQIEGFCEEDVSPVDKVQYTDQAVEVIRVLVSVAKGKGAKAALSVKQSLKMKAVKMLQV